MSRAKVDVNTWQMLLGVWVRLELTEPLWWRCNHLSHTRIAQPKKPRQEGYYEGRQNHLCAIYEEHARAVNTVQYETIPQICFIFIIVNNQNCSKQLEGYLTSGAELQNRTLRNQGTHHVPQSKNSSGRKTFQIAGVSDWNSLLTELRKTTGIGSFKFNLFKQLRLRQWH